MNNEHYTQTTDATGFDGLDLSETADWSDADWAAYDAEVALEMAEADAHRDFDEFYF